jgi:hypothetical protein
MRLFEQMSIIKLLYMPIRAITLNSNYLLWSSYKVVKIFSSQQSVLGTMFVSFKKFVASQTMRKWINKYSKLVISWSLAAWVQTPSGASRCFLEEETLHSLLSTGWFQKRIRKCVYKLIASYTIELK